MLRKYQQLLILPLLMSLTSCAWFSKQLKAESEEDTEMVPKAHYDALMVKYQELEKKVSAPAAPPAMSSSSDPSDLVSELEKTAVRDAEAIEAKNTLMETVDVFDTKGTSVVTPNLAGRPMDTESSSGAGNIETEISDLKKAMAIAGQGKFDQATKMLQALSKSTNNGQIQVRAKFGTAEVFLAQKEYDLALQVYEDIINHHVYSGLVLNALKRAVSCAEKLNLNDKKVRYESLLKDVFGA